jgi:hypothetical protein
MHDVYGKLCFGGVRTKRSAQRHADSGDRYPSGSAFSRRVLLFRALGPAIICARRDANLSENPRFKPAQSLL